METKTRVLIAEPGEDLRHLLAAHIEEDEGMELAGAAGFVGGAAQGVFEPGVADGGTDRIGIGVLVADDVDLVAGGRRGYRHGENSFTFDSGKARLYRLADHARPAAAEHYAAIIARENLFGDS